MESGSLEEKIYRLGVQAYLFGYPLILTDITRNASVQRTGINRFTHARTFVTADFRRVVRPNVDTLYSTALLDLSSEPLVLSVPDTAGRYYIMQMSDAWTETFATPGKRTTGTTARQFVIVGPDWQGSLPSDIEVIRATTNRVWISGRTQTNGVDDYENVHAIQRGYRLAALSAWGKPEQAGVPAPASPAAAVETPPPVQVARMDAATFFAAFAALLKDNPPHPEDAPLVSELTTIGIERGKAFALTQLAPQAVRGLERAVRDARQQIALPDGEGLTTRNGWTMNMGHMGRYGTAYLERARTARFGLGALPPEEALYPSTAVDGSGQWLNGINRYVLHFGKDDLPPVQAFWSVTLYDAQGYFWGNPLMRYALGDRDKMRYNHDGSLDIYIQHDTPGKEMASNWLPSPQGIFTLTLRLYWPRPEVLSGRWLPPAVQRISAEN